MGIEACPHSLSTPQRQLELLPRVLFHASGRLDHTIIIINGYQLPIEVRPRSFDPSHRAARNHVAPSTRPPTRREGLQVMATGDALRGRGGFS